MGCLQLLICLLVVGVHCVCVDVLCLFACLYIGFCSWYYVCCLWLVCFTLLIGGSWMFVVAIVLWVLCWGLFC